MSCPTPEIRQRTRAGQPLTFADIWALLKHLLPSCPQCAAAWEGGLGALQVQEPRRLARAWDLDFWFTHSEPAPRPDLFRNLLAYPWDMHAYWITMDPRFQRPREFRTLEAYLDHAVTQPFEDRLHFARLLQVLTLHLSVADWDLATIAEKRIRAWRLVAEALLVRGQLEPAAEALTWAFQLIQGCGADSLLVAELGTSRALLACLRGDYAAARSDLRSLLPLYQRADEPLLFASTLVKLALVEWERLDCQAARAQLTRALDVLGSDSGLRLGEQAREILTALKIQATGSTPFPPGPFSARRVH